MDTSIDINLDPFLFLMTTTFSMDTAFPEYSTLDSIVDEEGKSSDVESTPSTTTPTTTTEVKQVQRILYECCIQTRLEMNPTPVLV